MHLNALTQESLELRAEKHSKDLGFSTSAGRRNKMVDQSLKDREF